METMNEHVSHAKNGEIESIRYLYDISIQELYTSACYLAPTNDHISILIRDAYIACFENLNLLSSPNSFRLWVKQILIRIAILYRRDMHYDSFWSGSYPTAANLKEGVVDAKYLAEPDLSSLLNVLHTLPQHMQFWLYILSEYTFSPNSLSLQSGIQQQNLIGCLNMSCNALKARLSISSNATRTSEAIHFALVQESSSVIIPESINNSIFKSTIHQLEERSKAKNNNPVPIEESISINDIFPEEASIYWKMEHTDFRVRNFMPKNYTPFHSKHVKGPRIPVPFKKALQKRLSENKRPIALVSFLILLTAMLVFLSPSSSQNSFFIFRDPVLSDHDLIGFSNTISHQVGGSIDSITENPEGYYNIQITAEAEEDYSEESFQNALENAKQYQEGVSTPDEPSSNAASEEPQIIQVPANYISLQYTEIAKTQQEESPSATSPESGGEIHHQIENNLEEDNINTPIIKANIVTFHPAFDVVLDLYCTNADLSLPVNVKLTKELTNAIGQKGAIQIHFDSSHILLLRYEVLEYLTATLTSPYISFMIKDNVYHILIYDGTQEYTDILPFPFELIIKNSRITDVSDQYGVSVELLSNNSIPFYKGDSYIVHLDNNNSILQTNDTGTAFNNRSEDSFSTKSVSFINQHIGEIILLLELLVLFILIILL